LERNEGGGQPDKDVLTLTPTPQECGSFELASVVEGDGSEVGFVLVGCNEERRKVIWAIEEERVDSSCWC
jgi:hypothetical protein